ncbi:MAG TPA: methyl-accepting chemotaxis protein [Spirochaetota bacterium]|nr:methyl-accepting chemotaxis protein [Spirochaetota bacterium]
MTKILSTTMNITSFFANVISMIEHQSAMVSELTASIEEILSTITSINNAVKDKITMTKGVAEKSKNGESEINKLLQSIGEISNIASLIRDAIKSINDLADKTNLLSMNASIEAAHAGEYGKGFAVVASEIRKLSSLTETNSKHIAKSLSDITVKVDATFESTKKSKEYVSGALRNTLDVARSMEEVIFGISGIYSESNQITDSVNNLLEMTQNVRASALEMGEKIKVIENSIKEINEICK